MDVTFTFTFALHITLTVSDTQKTNLVSRDWKPPTYEYEITVF